MTPDDSLVRWFLKRSKNVRVATLSAAEVPHITPLRFIRTGRSIYSLTRLTTRTVRDIEERPDVVLLFDAERPHGPVLRMRAHATVHTDTGLTAWYQRQATLRYFLRPGGLLNMIANRGRLSTWLGGDHGTGPGRDALIEFIPHTAEFLPVPR